MTTPTISILIPTISSRSSKAEDLFYKLEARRGRGNLPVEILMLLDNRQRSVGLKRQALLDVARGDFVAFCDDDDDVADDYLAMLCEAAGRRPDVITFIQSATVNGAEGHVDFSLRHPVDEPWQAGATVTRRPWHVCAWRRTLAQQCVFTDKMFGEDRDWVDQAVPLARTEAHIAQVLQFYRYDSKTSEAPAGS